MSVEQQSSPSRSDDRAKDFNVTVNGNSGRGGSLVTLTKYEQSAVPEVVYSSAATKTMQGLDFFGNETEDSLRRSVRAMPDFGSYVVASDTKLYQLLKVHGKKMFGFDIEDENQAPEYVPPHFSGSANTSSDQRQSKTRLVSIEDSIIDEAIRMIGEQHLSKYPRVDPAALQFRLRRVDGQPFYDSADPASDPDAEVHVYCKLAIRMLNPSLNAALMSEADDYDNCHESGDDDDGSDDNLIEFHK